MIDYNLHTHSRYCGHGEGNPSDYAESALRSGLKVLGFTEHLPFPDDRLSASRMAYAMKDRFTSDVAKVREEYSKKGLEVLLGWECDYFDDMEHYYEELRQETDYLIFGTHYTLIDGSYRSIFTRPLAKSDLALYADSTIKGMRSGFFTYLAHPDVFFIGYEKFDDEAKAVSKAIIDAAKDLGMILEANGNGLIRPSKYDRPSYPMREFWDMAVDKGIRTVPATDAHKPENTSRSLPMLEGFFSSYPGFRFLKVDEVLGRR